ncbi:sensor histidine kinase [Parvibium lacunae]|uniref:histidine kinase n=1 Tax=Parvibium lacunae TaxID=1888893 RepID=A0A368L1C9_9BURK|nr:sensor histidine kinase [Parvibium lacunae]RCS57365.1 sensor histidine kinase [Parvibium lacunae]
MARFPLRRRQRAESDSNPPPDEASRSLFGEILDWMLAPLLLLWPMSIGVTYLVAQAIANGPFDRALDDSTTVLAQQLKVMQGQLVLSLPLPARDILRADDTDSIYFQVLGSRGELLAGEENLPLPNEAENNDWQRQPSLTHVVRLRNDTFNGQEVRIAYTWVKPAALPTAAQPALVQVAETLDKRGQLANEIVKGVILPQFIILPIAVILVWFGLTRGIRPLAELQQRLRARRSDDLSAIDTRQAPEELTPLLHAFNDLLHKLDQTVSGQKRFIADAAHQMKTPLAGLRMQAELALTERDPERIKHSLRLLAQSTERATRLINQLLSMARAESTVEGSMQFTVIDLNQLAKETIQTWLNRALAQQVDLGFESLTEEAGLPVQVMGNATLLHELLNNLIDNAFRYALPSRGIAVITLRVGMDLATQQNFIELEDNGPGIPSTERTLIFERFYRVLGTQTDGSGLGLAIAREIAALHNAQIEVLDPRIPNTLSSNLSHAMQQDSPPISPSRTGVRFVISFPRFVQHSEAEQASLRWHESL